MSMSDYVLSAAEALRLQVHPGVETNSARDALDNSIRVLTAVANALDPNALVETPATFSGRALADTDRLVGPAENPAARRSTAVPIAELAGRIDSEGDTRTNVAREAIAWEKALLDAAIAAFDAIERAEPSAATEAASNIDRGRLERYLRSWSGDTALTVDSFKLIVGGRSRQTALFTITGGGALPQAMVVQRAIPGQKPGAAFLGERGQFELLSALHKGGMRVPPPVLVEEDESHLDASFILVAQSPGSPILTDYWGTPSSEGAVLDLAREMALLHSQPIDTMIAARPEARQSYSVESWRTELESLAADWHASARWPSITMSAAIAWMRANVECLDDRRAIVHNDMVFHNILGEGDRITAVLDWEQANIGHPGEDVGYCFPYVAPVVEWDRFLAAYRAAGGPALTDQQVAFFALRAGLRLMNLVMHGGRDAFDKRLSTDVLLASAAAHFTQRLLHRVAGVLDWVLSREA